MTAPGAICIILAEQPCTNPPMPASTGTDQKGFIRRGFSGLFTNKLHNHDYLMLQLQFPFVFHFKLHYTAL
jgi:hypothetical protein